MTDALYDGRGFRTLNVIDEGNREGLAIEIGTSIPSARVIRGLDDLIRLYGRPAPGARGQRARAHRGGVCRVVHGAADHHWRYPAGKAGPERLHRAIQSHVSRRGPRRVPLRLPRA